MNPSVGLFFRRTKLHGHKVVRFGLLWLLLHLSLLPAHAGAGMSLGADFAGSAVTSFAATLPESGRIPRAEDEHETGGAGPDQPPLWLAAAPALRPDGVWPTPVAAARTPLPAFPEFFLPHLRAPPLA